MAWFSSNISLGNIADLAGGAVNKLQESVKSIEKNFDSALGFEEKDKADSSNEGSWTSSTDKNALFNPVMAFMGHKNVEDNVESSQKPDSSKSSEAEKRSEEDELPQHLPISEDKEVVSDEPSDSATENTVAEEERRHPEKADGEDVAESNREKDEIELPLVPIEHSETALENFESSVSLENSEKEVPNTGGLSASEPVEEKSRSIDQEDGNLIVPDQSDNVINKPTIVHEQTTESESTNEANMPDEEIVDMASTSQPARLFDAKTDDTAEPSLHSIVAEKTVGDAKSYSSDLPVTSPNNASLNAVSESAVEENKENLKVGESLDDTQQDISEQDLGSRTHNSKVPDSVHELTKLKKEMKMMENALQGAARQAQAKADEIAKLMNENEQLKSVVDELKRRPSDVEIETLREEYHQRVATLERKVYALTKERDTLRREQNKKSDAALLLKEKDEIINQVMAEGEELSKKQAAQETHIRKLRAQIRELEEEKKGLATKLQVEENKVESIKKDKTATEKLLQETIERHQSELTLQKDFYTDALAAAKEAEALAEARINSEARTELESRLREAEERESMLVQTLEELRQTLSRKEQQAVFREDTLLRDIEDLQRRYQASERRCEELITQVPDSTRPLLRQIEAMQETTARRAEAWAAVERSLTSRLQEAEAKAASAEERERSVNERLSQTLSRINVLEAQISCLRAEQTQLSKSLEKERQRAAENRHEYLVAKEEADTQEGRVNQLEEEIRELKRKQKQDLLEAFSHREQLQRELENEKAARLALEKTTRVHSAVASDQTSIRQSSTYENGSLSRKISSASSLGSMEESYYLQATLDSSDSLSERRNAGEASISPFYIKSMTPGAFEAALRQKEGELSSYMSRLASMEAIRDSLAEELVKMTEQCEKLRAEAYTLPGIRAELESLRRRHSAALELMGERDEELEELRADIIDLKEMYREQVNLLVNKIQNLSS